MPNQFPKLHNAMWPCLVGKGSPGAEPPIDLDTMLDLTAKASVNGQKFDGVDIFLFDPHVNIDSSDDDIKKLADKVRAKGFVVGSVVAPIWPPTGGGAAMGDESDRRKFVESVRKAARIAKKLRDLGARPYGVIRIDSASGVDDWHKDPEGNQHKIADTVHGSGTHDKTGRHCMANDPTGKLDIPKHAGYWLRDDKGNLTKAVKHICWDGCMFPNEVMMKQQTWNDILGAMVKVREQHGWN